MFYSPADHHFEFGLDNVANRPYKLDGVELSVKHAEVLKYFLIIS
jgi:hypothetical protein